MKLKERQLAALRRPRLSQPLVEWGRVALQWDRLREIANRTDRVVFVAEHPQRPDDRVRGRTRFFVHLDDANFRVLPEV